MDKQTARAGVCRTWHQPPGQTSDARHQNIDAASSRRVENGTLQNVGGDQRNVRDEALQQGHVV